MKLFLVKRKLLTLVACLLCAAAMFYIVNHPAVIGAAATTRQLPIYCVQRDQKVVSLSFDAAWGNEDTQQLIDILGKYNIKVTFFVVGEWVDKYPESVKALSDAGHEVMNHSNDHAHFNSLSAEEIVANINACSDKIEAITGVRPTLFRPPYGEYDDHVITTVRSMGIEPIQWDVETSQTAASSCHTKVYRSFSAKKQALHLKPGEALALNMLSFQLSVLLKHFQRYLPSTTADVYSLISFCRATKNIQSHI